MEIETRGRQERKIGDIFFVKNYRLKKINEHWVLKSGIKTLEYILDKESVIDINSDLFDAKILDITHENSKKIVTVKLTPHTHLYQKRSANFHECCLCKYIEQHDEQCKYIIQDDIHHIKQKECSICKDVVKITEKHTPDETKTKCIHCGFTPGFIKQLNNVSLMEIFHKEGVIKEELLKEIFKSSTITKLLFESIPLIYKYNNKDDVKCFLEIFHSKIYEYTNSIFFYLENENKCIVFDNHVSSLVSLFTKLKKIVSQIFNNLLNLLENIDAFSTTLESYPNSFTPEIEKFIIFNNNALYSEVPYEVIALTINKLYFNDYEIVLTPNTITNFIKLKEPVYNKYIEILILLVNLFYKAYIEEPAQKIQVSNL